MSLKIILTSVFVDNQEDALEFYTGKLGFVKKQEVPLGEFKWLTLVSPEAIDGVELLLEPSDNPVTKAYKKGLVEQGIPAASFGVSNIDEEYNRLISLGVNFSMEPAEMGPVKIAVFDDTCGNLIQLMQDL